MNKGGQLNNFYTELIQIIKRPAVLLYFFLALVLVASTHIFALTIHKRIEAMMSDSNGYYTEEISRHSDAIVAISNLLAVKIPVDGMYGQKNEIFTLYDRRILFGAFILSIILLYILYAMRHVFKSLHVRAHFKSIHKHMPCIVFFVSKHKISAKFYNGSIVLQVQKFIGENKTTKEIVLSLPEKIDCANDIKAFCNTKEVLEAGSNWEMVIRGIIPHWDGLKRIYLISSENITNQTIKNSKNAADDGSKNEANELKKLLDWIFMKGKRHVDIILPSPVDYEQIDEISNTLAFVLDDAVKAGFKHSDVLIDVTGGQKPTSIAGAAYTFSSRIAIQYVQTGRNKEAMTYDIVFHDRMPEPSH